MNSTTKMAPKSGRKLKLKHLKALSKNRLKFRLASLTNMEALFYKRYLGVQFITTSRERIIFYAFKEEGAYSLMEQIRINVQGSQSLLDLRLRGELETGGEDLPEGLPTGEYRRFPAGWQSRQFLLRELGAIYLGHDCVAFV